MISKEMITFNIADIHNGESKTTAKHIYINMKEYLLQLPKLTHMFVCGDFTHRQLTASSEEYQYTKKTFLLIVNYCIEKNIKLRFIEGTPSHDYRQVETLSLSVPPKCDFKYYKDVHIEYDKDYGAYILYVPDEMGDDRLDVLTKIKNKMLELNITKVDIAVMHGSFIFHMPGKTSYLIEDFNFVEYFIVIGHNHTKSIVGNIITPGSYERNFYGEEESKGGYLIKISPFHKDLTIRFIENINSHILDTIDLTDCDMTNASIKLLNKINGYKSQYLRVDITNNSLIDKNVLIKLAKDNNIKLEIKNKKDKTINKNLILDTKFEDLNINRNNIIKLINSEINDGNDYFELLKDLI